MTTLRYSQIDNSDYNTMHGELMTIKRYSLSPCGDDGDDGDDNDSMTVIMIVTMMMTMMMVMRMVIMVMMIIIVMMTMNNDYMHLFDNNDYNVNMNVL